MNKLLVGALALAFTGPGAFSLDAVLRIADPWPVALTPTTPSAW